MEPPTRQTSAWRTVVRKYINIYRVSLIERMAYRGDFLLGSVLRFLPLVTTVLLWRAAYEGARHPSRQDISRLHLRRDDRLPAAGPHQPHVFQHARPGRRHRPRHPRRNAQEIPDSTARFDRLSALLPRRPQDGLHRHVVPSLRDPVLHFAAATSTTSICPTAPRSPPMSSSLLLGFLVGFFFEACIGMVGFWFLEIGSFLYVVNTVNFFVSGQLFPLDLLPPSWARPVQGAAVPVHGLLPGRRLSRQGARRASLSSGLLIEAAWAVALIVLARLAVRPRPAPLQRLRRVTT